MPSPAGPTASSVTGAESFQGTYLRAVAATAATLGAIRAAPRECYTPSATEGRTDGVAGVHRFTDSGAVQRQRRQALGERYFAVPAAPRARAAERLQNGRPFGGRLGGSRAELPFCAKAALTEGFPASYSGCSASSAGASRGAVLGRRTGRFGPAGMPATRPRHLAPLGTACAESRNHGVLMTATIPPELIYPSDRGPHDPTVIYNSLQHEYLMVFSGSDGLCCRRLADDGSLLPGEQSIELANVSCIQTRPGVAYNPAANGYGVVYQRHNGIGVNIGFGGELLPRYRTSLILARLDAAGVLLGKCVLDESWAGVSPLIACNARTGEYLAVWTRNANIVAQRVGPSGQLLGAVISVSPAEQLDCGAAVAYNWDANEYMVVYTYCNLNKYPCIYAQRISAGGSLVGPPALLGDVNRSSHNPSLAYSQLTHEYLVMFVSITPDRGQVFCQRLPLAGPPGKLERVAKPEGANGYPQVVASTNPQTSLCYLAVWTSYAGDWGIRGKYIAQDGSAVSIEFPLAESGKPAAEPNCLVSACYNSHRHEFFALWSMPVADGKGELRGRRLRGSPLLQQVASGASPGLTVFNDKLHLGYIQKDAPNALMHISSGDGVNWSPEERVGTSSSKAAPSLVAFGGCLHLIFLANNASNDLLHVSSPDGTTWGTETWIATSSSRAAPGALVFNGRLHLVYIANNDSQTLLHRSSADGVTWGKESAIGFHASKATPALAAFNGLLHLVYIANNDSNLLLHTSSTDGENWRPERALGTAASKAGPSLACHNGLLHLAYIANDKTNTLLHNQSSDGVNWGPERAVATVLNASGALEVHASKAAPSLVAFRGRLHLAYLINFDLNVIARISADSSGSWARELMVMA